jgi:hypothetical protein
MCARARAHTYRLLRVRVFTGECIAARRNDGTYVYTNIQALTYIHAYSNIDERVTDACLNHRRAQMCVRVFCVWLWAHANPR